MAIPQVLWQTTQINKTHDCSLILPLSRKHSSAPFTYTNTQAWAQTKRQHHIPCCFNKVNLQCWSIQTPCLGGYRIKGLFLHKILNSNKLDETLFIPNYSTMRSNSTSEENL